MRFRSRNKGLASGLREIRWRSEETYDPVRKNKVILFQYKKWTTKIWSFYTQIWDHTILGVIPTSPMKKQSDFRSGAFLCCIFRSSEWFSHSLSSQRFLVSVLHLWHINAPKQMIQSSSLPFTINPQGQSLWLTWFSCCWSTGKLTSALGSNASSFITKKGIWLFLLVCCISCLQLMSAFNVV